MGLGIIEEMFIIEQQEAVKIFLPYIFLSLPRFAGLVTLDILSAVRMTALRFPKSEALHATSPPRKEPQ